MKLGSLFDGSGGFPLAGSMCGVEPVWAAEVEPFPIRVTKKRFPHMKHLGDINKINGAEIEPVDIICGGSPCQGMSLAGQREGLNDHRSVLFYQMIRVIKEMYEATNGEYPRYIVWENVVGSFSSNNGDDFRCVLEEFCRVKEPSVHIPKPSKWESAGCIKSNGYSLAWRVYDAQYWGRTIISPTGELVQRGTPQRRKRIYLVVDLAGERADRILFDREGMSGHSYQSEKQRQGIAVVAEDCIRRSSGTGVNKAVAFMGGQGSNAGSLGCSADVYPTIRATQSGSNSIPNVCYDPEWFSVNGYAEYVNKPPVLRASGGDAGGHRSSDRPIIRCMGNGQLQQMTMSEICNTLDCMHDKQAILYETVYDMTHANDVIREYRNTTPTLQHRMGTGGNQVPIKVEIAPPKRKYIVRRLTPLECCRLQGFPDWWCEGLVDDEIDSDELAFWRNIFKAYCSINRIKTKSDKQIIKWLQSEPSDSAIYKMWGNGIALPCALDVMRGIVENQDD